MFPFLYLGELLLLSLDFQSDFRENQPRNSPAIAKKNGRDEHPSAGIIDTQTVKGTQESGEESGFDGGKLIKRVYKNKID